MDTFQYMDRKLQSLRKTVGPNNVRDPVTGFTCLHHAALNNHSTCVKLILDYGAKVNAVDYKGSSALHLAAWAGNLDVVKLLLGRTGSAPSRLKRFAGEAPPENSPEGDARSASPIELDLCNNDNQTPLSLAAQFGHERVVAELLSRGANVHLRNSRLESALDLACLHGRLGTVRLLLDSSSLLVAQLRQPTSCARLIDCPGAHELPDQRPFSMSFDTAASGGSPPATGSESARRPSAGAWSTLLRGRNRDSNDHHGSPLQRLTAGTLSLRQKQPHYSRQSEVTPRRATTTLAPGLVPVRTLDHSPLHYAIRQGRLEVARLLLVQYGANLLQVTNLGSCLHEAALNNGKHAETISFLFQHLADHPSRCQLIDALLNLQDSQRRTVFDVLEEMNTRTGREIKRLIYEFSEQLMQPASECGLQRHAPHTDRLGGRSSPAWSRPKQASSQIFSDINSFVTMKRAPRASAARHHQQVAGQLGSQTIDRLEQQQAHYGTGQRGWLERDNPAISATQSVSNLTQLVGGQAPRQLRQAHQMCARPNENEMWPGSSQCEYQWPAQMRHDRASTNQLVRSQTDCSHLMSRFLVAGERISEQPTSDKQPVDRRTINRHYHVYEHEFYPPRLLASQEANETGRAWACPPVDLVDRCCVEPVAKTRADSRLSLNLETIGRRQTVVGQQQQRNQPMDRFLDRHSRKLTHPSQPLSEVNKRSDLFELQQHLISQTRTHDQPISCGLAEPQSFESTRRALLDDFDQMIGRELLNRDHQDIIRGFTGSKEPSSMQLTSVMLDMDQQGEHLIVSGTRLLDDKRIESASSCSLLPEASSQPSPAQRNRASPPYVTVPPKPPRPSLSRTTRKDKEMYEQPSQERPRDFEVRGSYRALTKPPRVRPPPPPSSLSTKSSLTNPLKVIAPEPILGQSIRSAGSSISSGSAESTGLLKLASQKRPPTTRAQMSIGSTSTDGDSGVCTSNSPASLSHDHEELAIEQQLAKSSGRLMDEAQASVAPPSPNTAQMHIEEVLMPLAQSTTNDQTTSPLICCAPAESKYASLTSTCSTMADVVDRWLDAELTCSSGSPAAPSSALADYENCRALQLQLRGARCSSVGDLLSAATGRLSGKEDGDYAGSATSSGSPISLGSTSSSSSRPTESAGAHREFMLRVVVAEPETLNSPGDSSEVFYINPTELKKISRSSKRSQVDAETLTDEELCAAIDQESGLIRFTLRKRRGQQQVGQVQDESQQTMEPIESYAAYDGQMSSVAVKKTKLNESDQDVNNNPAQSRAEALTRWFHTKLPHLVGYVRAFTLAGLDYLELLNHSAFIDHNLLSQIGVAQEPDRDAILDAVKADLVPVDLDTLTSGLDCDKSALEELLVRLHLSSHGHLFASCQTLAEAREKVTSDELRLPVGSRARLLAALSHLQPASAGSGEVEMDVSQPSSSSSRESIKSIVVAPNYTSASPDRSSEKEKEKEKENEIGWPSERATNGKLDARKLTIKLASNGSLVSEAARKLEAAALAANQPLGQVQAQAKTTPVAAARRAKTEAAGPDESSRKTAPSKVLVCWPPKSTQTQSEQNKSKSKSQPLEQEAPDTTDEPGGRLSELRSNYQRQIETKRISGNQLDERVQVRSNQASKLTRPKPAPPAKPAKLAVVGKLSLELASQRL